MWVRIPPWAPVSKLKLPGWVYDPDEVLDELYEFKAGDLIPSEHGANVFFAVDCWGMKRKNHKELFVLCDMGINNIGYAIVAVDQGAVLRDVTIWNIAVR